MHPGSPFEQVIIQAYSAAGIHGCGPYYGMWSVFYFHTVHGFMQPDVFICVFKKVDLVISVDQSTEAYTYQPDKQTTGVKFVKQFQGMFSLNAPLISRLSKSLYRSFTAMHEVSFFSFLSWKAIFSTIAVITDFIMRTSIESFSNVISVEIDLRSL